MSEDLVTWCIDFGTSFTSVGVAAPGRAVRTATMETDGARSRGGQLRSVVMYDPHAAVRVGLDAYQHAQLGPERYISRPKSQLGVGLGGFAEGVCTVLLDGQVTLLPAPEVCGWVLRHAYARAAATMPEPDRLVLTHPASWDVTRTTALRRACEHAGLPPVTLLPEPVAAARALAAEHAGRLPPGTIYLVYDLGGGTCDIALLRRAATGPDEVLDSGGSAHVGGDAFDHCLLQRVYDQVLERDEQAAANLCSPIPVTDSAEWNVSRLRLFEDITTAREVLSSRESFTIEAMWPDRGGRLVLPITFSRAEFEAAIKDLLDDTIAACDRVLDAAGLAVTDLGAVLLTGGASRTPVVADTLAAWAATEPIAAGALADAAVALGGAMPEARAPKPAPPPPPRPRTVAWKFGGSLRVASSVYAVVAPWSATALVAASANTIFNCDLDAGSSTPWVRVGDGWTYQWGTTWPRALTLNRSGTTVASGTDDRGTVEAWKITGGGVTTLAPGSAAIMGRWSTSVALDDDGDTFVVRGGYLERWMAKERKWRVDVAAGTRVVLCPSRTGVVTAGSAGVRRHNWSGAAEDIASDAAYGVAASASTLYVAFRTTVAALPSGSPTHQQVHPLPSGATPAASAASRQGTEFAVGMSDGSIHVWPRSGATPSELSYSSPVTSLAFTPGGEKLVAGHADGAVRWWVRV